MPRKDYHIIFVIEKFLFAYVKYPIVELNKIIDNEYMKKIKPLIRWVILGGTLFFFLTALKDHWEEFKNVRLESGGWLMLAIALTITLMAHVWSGLVWSWILATFKLNIGKKWAIAVYLKTNIAKYIPGNVWHYYGRITAVKTAGASVGIASLSVLLEPLLMAAAAAIIILVSGGLDSIEIDNISNWKLQIFCLGVVLVGVHPCILNPLLRLVTRLKGNKDNDGKIYIKQYPLLPLLGEIGFVGLRGIGFLFVLLALMKFSPTQIPHLFAVFSFAWLLGLIVPGAPGGMGVFEATAIALVDKHQFSYGIILSLVASYRAISILAEAIAAGAVSTDFLQKFRKEERSKG